MQLFAYFRQWYAVISCFSELPLAVSKVTFNNFRTVKLQKYHIIVLKKKNLCVQGIAGAFVREQSDELLAQVQLQGVAAVRSGRYSGGMRRRLSVAIALLGAPKS